MTPVIDMHSHFLPETWPDLAERFVSGTDVYLPDETHFMPMEKPELAARIIAGES